MSDRYLVIPCESEPDLAVIWDKLHERVFDVIDAREAARFAADDLWSPTPEEQHSPVEREGE